MGTLRKLADWINELLKDEQVPVAYEKGWMAGFKGGENPYEAGTDDHAKWEEGKADVASWLDNQWWP